MCGTPNKEKKRVWIDSQTEEAILNGIKDAKDISFYNDLSDSAFLRAKEDYLIGINFSRLLSLAYARELAKVLKEEKVVISVGRVMTCVLGMIVSREREIRNFKKVNFYKIQGIFGNETSDISFDWRATEGSKVFESPLLYNETGFKKKENAEKFIEYIKNGGSEATICKLNKKTTKENPPLLFNLAEIQNECSKRYKITPDDTLQIIQELYEKKLVTYPRTDARVLSSAVAKVISKNLNGLAKSNIDPDIKKHLDKMIKEKYSIKLEKTKYVDDSKITDHYAIIPTGQGFENYGSLKELQKSIYHLIVKRFIAIFYPAAEFEKISCSVKINNEEFIASGKICKKIGYLQVIKDDKEEKKEQNNKEQENLDLNNSLLQTLKKGDKIELKSLNIKEGETTPPSRYSSGSMILAMENAGKLIEDETLREQIKGSGIGTSATRAEIIKKLVNINYINLNPKTQILTPSIKGEKIYDIVRGTIPDMLNPELTASWEKGLAMVADGSLKKEEFQNKLESYVRNKVVKYKKIRNEYLYGI